MLHWEVSPSGTWARHSFATNLTHAGVERLYIDEGMDSLSLTFTLLNTFGEAD